MPDAVSVANCREKIERSFSVTRLLMPGMLISFCMPWPDCAMESGTIPRWRSSWAAAASFEASILPLLRLPVASTLL